MNKIKFLKGQLYPYQLEGVEFFVRNNGGMLFDEMGVGKSAQAIGYIVHSLKQKILIVCPSSVKYAWENECLKWSYLRPCVICDKNDINEEAINNYEVFIINYDLLHYFVNIKIKETPKRKTAKYAIKEEFLKIGFDCLIIDECHFIKSIKSRRNKITTLISRYIPSKILLSGTPMLNRTAELFSALNIIDNKIWNNWFFFTQRYSGGHFGIWGYEAKGATNIEELKNRINKYYLRREKKDVLKDLPSKIFTEIPFVLPSDSRNEYNLAVNSLIEYLKSYKEKDSNSITKSMKQEELVRLNELRQITTNAKFDTAKEIIENIIENENKIVIFSCYNSILKNLYEYFKKQAVIIIGETSDIIRKESIEKFQNDDKIKIFLGGYLSAGIGITLTRASNILLCDQPWRPSDKNQAIDRCHRIGQEAESINIMQIIAKNTIDSMMLKILKGKEQLFNQIFGENNGQKQISLTDELIQDIKNNFI